MITVKAVKSLGGLKYNLERRVIFDKPYIKVFISDISQLEAVRTGLLGLEEVRKVNITEQITSYVHPRGESNAPNPPKPSLTVYPERFYSVEDCLEAVNDYLSGFTPNVVEHPMTKQSEAHFAEIEQQILSILDEANAMIDVCVAWFTSDVLRNKLLEKQTMGVKVRVIIFDDGINSRHGVDLTGISHKIIRGARNGIMHKKYCVVDNAIVISGSYNWTINAEHKNDEDITIERNDIVLASSFTRDFNEMWGV